MEAAGAADVAQEPAGLEARDVEHRRRPEQRLSSRQPLQLKAETIFQRRHRLQGLAPATTRNCLFTPFRIEDTSRVSARRGCLPSCESLVRVRARLRGNYLTNGGSSALRAGGRCWSMAFSMKPTLK